MLIKYNIKALAILSLMLLVGLTFNACDDDEEKSSGVVLNSFGPSPALRGGELRFIGENLNQVTTITLPGNVEVSSFKEQSSEQIVIDVPQETALHGIVILHTPDGDIETKTELGISEPIAITSISPTSARPGDELTITGTYLNLIKEVIFADQKSVTEFQDQSQTEIKVIVPADAQTGSVIISNGLDEPILVESNEELTVVTPVVSTLSPPTVKAGTNLTITGTDLDLVQDITFTGGSTRISEFVSQSATEIVVQVPADAQDGVLTLRPASGLELKSESAVTLLLPTIATISPNPAKNGTNISVTGTDLDLITSVIFGGKQSGEIQAGGSATSIQIVVPPAATDSILTFNTGAKKFVTSATPLTLIVPTITSITPDNVNTKDRPSVTITGTNLDIVETVVFEGGFTADASGTATQITLEVVPGSLTGKVKLVTTNGTEVTSSQTLTIIPDVPSIPAPPAEAFLGSILTLTGTNINVPADIIFPGNVKATMFGIKNATTLEVFVPMNVPVGKGKVKFVTDRNEIYETAEINFKLAGVEPVQDEALVFFNFNGTGAKDSWWGAVSLVEDANAIDGTSYGRVNQDCNGWTDLFWRNSKNNFPAATIGSSVADYVLKFDIRIVEPITGGNLKFKLGGPNDAEFWWAMGPEAPGANGAIIPSANWTTITVPISAFKDNWGWGSNSPIDLNNITGAFGAAFDNGTSKVNIMIDNVRFHKVN